MKTIFIWILLLHTVLCGKLLAQEMADCGTASLGQAIDLTQEGGIYVPAGGVFKVLVVFARFRDDVDPHPYWPVGGNPDNYSTFIDPNQNTNSTHYINLTHYYKKMSIGTYKVFGQAVSVQTPHDKAYYITPPSTLPDRFLANKDVLQNAVDPLINFADYDKWRYDSDYHHTEVSDGTVDMIVMIWRGHNVFDNWGGEASLGYGGSFSVENGTKTIATSYRGYGEPGSGVTIHYWGERAPEVMFKASVHEVGHWLLGIDHPYTNFPTTDNHIAWGMLTRGGDGICANTYERE